jgi:serine/threonine protein kinase
MPSDSSNAQDALHGQAEPAGSKREPESGAATGGLQSANPPRIGILDDDPIDPEEPGRALLSELSVGSVVDAKYRIDEVLGRGAMGVVVAATHLQLGERVALKFLLYRPKTGVTDDFRSRFQREARVSARLKNEHITRVIDVGVWQGHVPYMVMDHLTGTDLRQVLRTHGPLPIPMALDYTVQVCEGIAEAHVNGVVHRDLKPSNVFITRRPDGADLVKILDFGISKWSSDEAGVDELTQTGVVLGSPKYMAPEQLFGSSDVDARADVWSIGAMLYEMLAGRPPFDQASFTKICAELSTDRMPPPLAASRADVPPELAAVVMRCFERTVDRRVHDVAELAGEVLAAVKAPFADAVRAKIAATLEPRSGRDAASVGGGMTMGSGTYAQILAQTGSGPAVRLSTPPARPAEASGASPATVSMPPPAPARRLGWWLGAGAAAVVGLVVFLASRGPTTGPSPAASALVAATTTADPGAPVAATPPSATATTAASSPPPAPPPSARARLPVPVAGGWHASTPRTPTATAKTATVAAVPPPLQVTAAPAPTPAPTPIPTAITPKPDPLGDRQ